MFSLEEVIKGCRQYNKFAQKLLYEKYAPEMRGVCLRYIADIHILDDIIQEGFIKVFSNIKQFSGTGSFEGWMKRIFINTAISYLRKKQRQGKFIDIDDWEKLSIADQNSPDSSAENGEINPQKLKDGEVDYNLIESADFSENEMLNVLQKLPEKFRIVFNLYCIENLKHEEIAEILKIETSTSRTRLLRARILIQKELYDLTIEKLSI